jgi:hypothetical protein
MSKPLPEVHVDFEQMNHSELIQLANFNELNASRATPREMVIEALQTFTPFPARPFDGMRISLNKWLTRWWDALRMQMPKKVCPDCFQCRDAQILACFERNRSNIERKT